MIVFRRLKSLDSMIYAGLLTPPMLRIQIQQRNHALIPTGPYQTTQETDSLTGLTPKQNHLLGPLFMQYHGVDPLN